MMLQDMTFGTIARPLYVYPEYYQGVMLQNGVYTMDPNLGPQFELTIIHVWSVQANSINLGSIFNDLSQAPGFIEYFNNPLFKQQNASIIALSLPQGFFTNNTHATQDISDPQYYYNDVLMRS